MPGAADVCSSPARARPRPALSALGALNPSRERAFSAGKHPPAGPRESDPRPLAPRNPHSPSCPARIARRFGLVQLAVSRTDASTTLRADGAFLLVVRETLRVGRTPPFQAHHGPRTIRRSIAAQACGVLALEPPELRDGPKGVRRIRVVGAPTLACIPDRRSRYLLSNGLFPLRQSIRDLLSGRAGGEKTLHE